MGGSGLFVGFFSVSTTSFALFRQNNFFKHLGCPPLTSTPENVWEKQSLGKSPETLFSSIHECHRNYMSSCQFVEYVWIMWGCKIICLLCQFYFWEKVLSHQLVPLPLLCFVLSPNDQILETTRRRNLLTKKDKYYSEYNGPINGRLCWIICRLDSFFYIKNSIQFGRACSVFCTLVDFRCWILDTLWWNGDLLWF